MPSEPVTPEPTFGHSHVHFGLWCAACVEHGTAEARQAVLRELREGLDVVATAIAREYAALDASEGRT